MIDYPIQVRTTKTEVEGKSVEVVLAPSPTDIISDKYARELIAELEQLPQAWVYVISKVLNRPTPAGFVEWRDGPSNTRVAYVSPEYAIATRAALARIGVGSDLEVIKTDVDNEACQSLCKLTLKFFHNNQWSTMTATQWGDCTRRSGMELGSVKKGSVTDGAKKCLHEFGWAMDVYSTVPVRIPPPDPEQMRLQSLETMYTIASGKGLTHDETDAFIASVTNNKKLEELKPVDITSIKRKLQKLSEDEAKAIKLK